MNKPILGRYIVTTAATSTAVTLTEVKSHLKITASSEDTYLTNLISVATEMVQNYTGQILIDSTIDLYIPYFLNRIDINRTPVTRITHVKYYDSSNSQQTVNSSNYIDTISKSDSLDQSPISAFILPAKNFTYPDTYPRMDAVEIRFEAGYENNDSVPMAIKQAMFLIIGQLYLNRTDMVYKMPVLSEYLLNPFRIATV
jgi:uncharacterized phiE125 gp8 family phage protein